MSSAMPIYGTHTSRRGVPVQVNQVAVPGSALPHVELRYGPGGGIGRVVWYPVVARCFPDILRVFDYFQADRDNLGQEIQLATAAARDRLKKARERRFSP